MEYVYYSKVDQGEFVLSPLRTTRPLSTQGKRSIGNSKMEGFDAVVMTMGGNGHGSGEKTGGKNTKSKRGGSGVGGWKKEWKDY